MRRMSATPCIIIQSCLLFYLFTFLSLSPAAAQDTIRRSCRQSALPAHLAARRAPGHAQADLTAYQGHRRQLTVLAEFSDQAFLGDEEATLLVWNRILNERDFSQEPFVGSVHDYFYAQSYGQFSVTFDLYYVQLDGSRARYRSTTANDENSQFLVNDIVDQLESMSINWSVYDWDGDGEVNQILIIFAGKGSGYGGFGGGTDAIWPHQWWLSHHEDPTTHEPCQPRTVSAADGSQYTIDSYCAVQELKSDGSYGIFGTICHEYSHCFGLPDFYYGSTSYLRTWDLMDYGNNNGGGFCPCGYSAHERMLLGWLTPQELTSGATVSGMAALADAPEAYLLRNEGYSNEFYLIENRQRKGWDASLPGSGVTIFHIDYDQNIWNGFDEYPNSPKKQRYVIIPANNKSLFSYSSGWPYPYETNNELTNNSTPASTLQHANTDGSLLMSKPLTNISVNGGLGSFDFMGGTAAIGSTTAATAEPTLLYRIGPIDIVRTADGSVRKTFRGN